MSSSIVFPETSNKQLENAIKKQKAYNRLKYVQTYQPKSKTQC